MLELAEEEVAVGWVEARECLVGPSPSPLLSQLDLAVAAAVEEEARSANHARKAAAGRMAEHVARFAAAEVSWGLLGDEREP